MPAQTMNEKQTVQFTRFDAIFSVVFRFGNSPKFLLNINIEPWRRSCIGEPMPYALEQLAAEVRQIDAECRHRRARAIGYITVGGSVADAVVGELSSPVIRRLIQRDTRSMISLRGGMWRLGDFYLIDARKVGAPVPPGAARFDVTRPDGTTIEYGAITVELSA